MQVGALLLQHIRICFSSCLYIIMVLKKGTTHPVLNLLLSQFDFVSRAFQRSLRVNKMAGAGVLLYIFHLLAGKTSYAFGE